MEDLDRQFGLNQGYLEEVRDRYARDPASVNPDFRRFFATWAARLKAESDGTHQPGLPDARADALRSLVEAIREEGHSAAEIDPLALQPRDETHLRPETYGLTEKDLIALPAHLLVSPLAESASNAAEGVARLRAIYCGALGYEFGCVDDADRRTWLRHAVESGEHVVPLNSELRRLLLKRLTDVETFERFLHRNFPGQKWFSLEGNDTLVPLLDELLSLAAHKALKAVGLGMAHRGRLNVLTHLLGKSYDDVLAEFEGGSSHEAMVEDSHEGWTLDVKYHEGGAIIYSSPDPTDASTIRLFLCPNPSHLELVNPVVLGSVRAHQEAVHQREPGLAPEDIVLSILVHGDASFAGQGIVAESLNLARLPGYSTGGTIHIIVNNQIGFTTEPPKLHSALYASGPANGLGMPIIHVNADDPLAVLAAARLAFAYRQRYHEDTLIDLIGYRRYGHNEGDEPTFTQPLMYEAIHSHPTARELWARRLSEGGFLSSDEAEAMVANAWDRLQEALRMVRGSRVPDEKAGLYNPPIAPKEPVPVPHPVSEGALRQLNEELHRLPEGFRLHPKLVRPFERRREAFDGDGRVDWAHAEALALASILTEGVPVRLSGQDTERGTFSQRHAVLHDVESGEVLVPLASLASAKAGFSICNSPLSEAAVLGFEYGYSVEAPRSLVLWEAQFGDFVNNAQSIVDEFIVSAEAKWGMQSGLVLLLPHGYEGQGPNHSSARLERFLQQAAEGNVRVVYPTTAAQYFHLLRWQAAIVQAAPHPLIVMTPKSLLRHPMAASIFEDLTAQTFRPVLDDPRQDRDPREVQRVVLCAGKVFTDVAGYQGGESHDVAVVRIEQLYPFPANEVSDVVRRYPNMESVVWVQEEPQNMGTWTYVSPLLADLLGETPHYIGRPRRASPAEGTALLHRQEQGHIVSQVFAGLPHRGPRR